MEKQIVKDFYGKIIGSLETQSNGDIIAKDFYGKILGKYDKANNVTKDFYGKILYRGNMVGSLITMNNK
jgi:extradiol dioxygenase family protein